MPAKGQRIDLTGNSYGKLTVVKYWGSQGRRSLWECRCTCGNLCIVNVTSLRNGTTKSCGCLRHEPKDNKFIDLTGKKFGVLTVLRRVSAKKSTWKCLCDCGNITDVYRGHLIDGHTRSCGCIGNRTHGMSKTRQYTIWSHVIDRCTNANSDYYKNYGGRGITVCEKWRKFEGFWEDMQNGYADDLTIERDNNDGNYEKGNCRWATKSEQNRNTRRSVKLSFRGNVKNLSEWSREVGISSMTIRHRLMNGWSIERSFTEPTLRSHN